MPHYRINIKLESDSMKEFVIEDLRKDIDLVYLDYRRRTYEKNGAGRVTYFDLVMIADESLKHLEDRKEVLNPDNNSSIINTQQTSNKFKKKKRQSSEIKLSLEERKKI